MRHTCATTLEPFQIRALLQDGVQVVAQNLSVPVAPVISQGSVSVAAKPSSRAAGVRTSMELTVEIKGRLPRTGVIELTIPNAFRLSDGDDTSVLQSEIGTSSTTMLPAAMLVESLDVDRGVAYIRVQRDIGTPDGIANSTVTCPVVGDPSTCVRVPPSVTAGALLLESSRLSVTLSQVRNLAGGMTGTFAVRTLLPDSIALVEINPQVRVCLCLCVCMYICRHVNRASCAA